MPVVGQDQGGATLLRRRGAEVGARIYSLQAARELRGRNSDAAPFVEVRALLDTGASGSAVDVSVGRRLNLSRRDFAIVSTPAGVSRRVQYEILLHIPQLELWRELRVFEVELAPQPHLALLGRDILSLGTLIYSGWKGGFEFCV